MKITKKIVGLIITAMVLMAIIDNVRGVFVPSFKLFYGIQNTQIGIMLLWSAISYMLGTYGAGFLIQKTNQKTAMFWGALAMGVGIASMVVSRSLMSFYIAMVIINTGISMLGLGINTMIPLLQVKNRAVLMNSVHFLYGAGATFTQKSTGILLTIGWTFKAIYLLILGVIVLLLLILGTSDVPEEDVHAKKRVAFGKKHYALMVIMGLGLGLYISAELQTANWLVNYIVQMYKYNENTASTYSAAFFFIFSFGRLAGGFVAERFGYMKSVIASTVIALFLYTSGLLLKESGLWLLVASGLFFSITFPTVVLSIRDYFKVGFNQASGVVITLASGTNMIAGLLIGVLADQTTIYVAMFTIPVVLMGSVFFLSIVWWKGHDLIKD